MINFIVFKIILITNEIKLTHSSQHSKKERKSLKKEYNLPILLTHILAATLCCLFVIAEAVRIKNLEMQ